MNSNGKLPANWIESALQSAMMPGSTINPRRKGAGGFRYVDIDALDNDRQQIASPKTLSNLEAPSRARMLIREGDVLFSLVRPYLKNIAVVPTELDGEVASTAYCVLRPGKGMESRFLFYQVVQESFIHSVPTYGNSPPSARDEEFLGIPIKIAPTNEQRRIVAKIEELFSKLDAGVTALKRVKANLKRYRASVLNATVEGKLTADWRAKHPNTEPASVLLERILKERRRKWEEAQLAKYAAAGKTPPKGWKEKYKEPAGVDAKSLTELPERWCWATVEQVSNLITKGSSPGWQGFDYVSQGIPFVRSQNVRWGSLDLEELVYLPVEFNDTHGNSIIRTGDVLLNLVGASIGRSAVASELVDGANTNQAVGIIRLVPEGVLNKLLMLFLLSPPLQEYIAKTKADVARANFNLDDVRPTPFPIACCDEQAAIVAEVERRLSIVDRLEAQVETDLKRAGRLRQSILKRAFAGKLVAQDPADEPAAKLLERIRRERQQAAESPKDANGKSPAIKRKDTREGFFRRAAVVAYIVNRLSTDASFGRTKLEKILHLTQTHIALSLDLEFKRYAAGPFDEVIYKLENVAKKRGWFETRNRPRLGVTYHPGPKSDDLAQRAIGYLGDKRAALDKLLDHMATLDTDQAELFATIYAAWNDLLIDGRPADEVAIIAEVYGWDESKAKFPPERITKCVAWMKKQGYVPTGQGKRTMVLARKSRLRSKRGRQQEE